MSLPQSIDAIRQLRPKRAFLTGMSHEFNYYTLNDELKRMYQAEDFSIEMGYDGLSFDINL